MLSNKPNSPIEEQVAERLKIVELAIATEESKRARAPSLQTWNEGEGKG